MLNREAVNLEQLLQAPLWVEPLLVGLAALVAISLVTPGVRIDVVDGQRQRRGVTGPEQYAVDSIGDQLDERAVSGRDGGHSYRHGLDDDEAECLLPGGGQEDRTRPGHQLGAPAAGDLADHVDRRSGRCPGRHLAVKGPRTSYDEAQPRVTGPAEVAVPSGPQQAE